MSFTLSVENFSTEKFKGLGIPVSRESLRALRVINKNTF